jgi:hypothetical protein
MEYVFIFMAQIFGIGFHVVQKIIALDKQYPEKTMKEIKSLFFENEWSSLMASILVLFTHLFAHGAIDYYMPGRGEVIVPIPFINVNVPFGLLGVGLALILGYGGQRIAYKYLGKYEQYLSDKAN